MPPSFSIISFLIALAAAPSLAWNSVCLTLAKHTILWMIDDLVPSTISTPDQPLDVVSTQTRLIKFMIDTIGFVAIDRLEIGIVVCVALRMITNAALLIGELARRILGIHSEHRL